jgi:hypothetical protein
MSANLDPVLDLRGLASGWGLKNCVHAKSTQAIGSDEKQSYGRPIWWLRVRPASPPIA